MINDILNEPQKIEIEDKIYLFEFDHLALASLEKKTGKSIYEIYDNLLQKKPLTHKESIALLETGMFKHHSENEIEILKKRLIEYPGFFSVVKATLTMAFSLPMMPPEILRECSFKKKDRITEQNNPWIINTTGAETT